MYVKNVTGMKFIKLYIIFSEYVEHVYSFIINKTLILLRITEIQQQLIFYLLMH